MYLRLADIRTRFEAQYVPEPNTGCWLWTGALVHGGYGKIRLGGKKKAAHRVSYEMFRGPIDDALVIDHLCRVRCCVNPDHLEPVSFAENIKRGRSGATNREKTHCPYGHEFSSDNTLVSRRRTNRICKACRHNQYLARKKN